jgi:CubicO group peptidase (beta-lactamase class C family)
MKRYFHVNYYFRNVLAIVLLLSLTAACIRLDTDEAYAQIDDYLETLAEAGEFSGSVLVAVNDSIILNQGYGLAHKQHRIPNTPHTRFLIHWITMQFTATSILLLQQEGRLNVYDPICIYISDCPVYWKDITIHHLLTHTSGVSDWIQIWGSEAEKPSNSQELVDRITVKEPYFAPGDEFRYSNNGYIILGHIIVVVSGQTYEDFLEDNFLDPLDMTNTGLGNDGIAIGYSDSGVQVSVVDHLYRYSASGIHSSIEDLYIWIKALTEEQIITKEALGSLFFGYAKTPSIDFPGSEYGYGWFVSRIHDRSIYFHGGLDNGFTSMIMYFPEDVVTIIVLRNYAVGIYDGLEIELANMIFN